jgi:tol-pal system protein YbgF
MRNGKATLPAILGVLILCGCAPRLKQGADGDTVFPEIDAAKINAGIDQALQEAQESRDRLDTLEANVSELDERILFISEETAGTSPARIEELETRLSLLTEAIKELQAQISACREQSAPAGAQEAARPPAARAAKGRAAMQSDSAPPATSLLVSPEYAAYQAALRLCNARNYKQAVAAFADMAQRYPGGRYADGANYWSGECSFMLADYPAAIASFEKVAAVHSSPKADDALFRIGQACIKTEQKAKAKNAFARLLEKFPGSEFVPRVEKYLMQLK